MWLKAPVVVVGAVGGGRIIPLGRCAVPLLTMDIIAPVVNVIGTR